MKIAVLFDGAGLSRLGLELAGHQCTGFELDPTKHVLSRSVGSGNCVLADVRQVDLSGFDAVWASPPCQLRSVARNRSNDTGQTGAFGVNLLGWSLALPHETLWVENVPVPGEAPWGTLYNAAQFELNPRQNRNRMIGGRYPAPHVFHPYKRTFPETCPTVLASEYKASNGEKEKRKGSRFYGRRMTLDEAAFHQGFVIPEAWRATPPGWTPGRWRVNLYEAIGNGVPVYMAYAFGQVLTRKRP